MNESSYCSIYSSAPGVISVLDFGHCNRYVVVSHCWFDLHYPNVKSKEIQPIPSEGDQPWDFFGGNDAEAETPALATSCEELTHWKRLWCWEGLGAGGEGDDRGWDGWMASSTRWMRVWVNSRSFGDGQGGLACCDSQGCKESDMTEQLNWTELNWCFIGKLF